MFRLIIAFAALQASQAFQPSWTVKPSTRLQASATADEDESALNRRAFLGSSMAMLVAASATNPSYAEEEAVAAAPLDYKAVAADIAGLVKANPDWGPTLVRLAWHSSGMCKCLA